MYSKEFLEALRLEIYSKRTDREKEIKSRFFISLNDEEQKMSLEIQKRELNEFVKGLGFEVGGLVKNKDNELFYVDSAFDIGGMLWIKDVCINLVKGNGNFRNSFSVYDRKAVKERPFYGIEDHQYMDLYEPSILKANENGQISLI